MELDYYTLKSAAVKIGCIEEDLISLAAEDKLSIYFKLGGRAILEMDRGCPDEWQEIAFYLWTQLKIHPLTFQRYQSNPSTLISELMNPDDPEEPGYCLKESVPLKDTTLFVSADDVTRLSQSEDYQGKKKDELDYYPLNLASKITGYSEDYLICLAADNKLPIYVRLTGNAGIELKETGDPKSPDVDECYLRGLYEVSIYTIQEYINNPLTSLCCLRKYPNNGYQYNLDTKIQLKEIALLISAKDVARISKKETDSEGSQAGTEAVSTKPEGKNKKRMKVLNQWYANLCGDHENTRELIIKAIDALTIDQIKKELTNLTPINEKHLWANGADRWIMDNGESVWLFKRTQGGKSKKPK